MITHRDAKHMCDALPGVGAVESLFIRCVSWHECKYGQAWTGAGVGSNNMGCITTAHPDTYSFKHPDRRNDDGTVVVYTTWFAGDPTPAKGFERLAATVLKPNVREALDRCDFFDAVASMHDNKYFLGVHARSSPLTDRLNVSDYYGAVVRACAVIGSATGETQPDVLPPRAAR